MIHVRLCIQVLFVVVITGCGALERPTLSRPPSHPLLNVASWLSPDSNRNSGQLRIGPHIKLPDTRHDARQFQRNLNGLNPAQYRSNSHVFNLVRATYRGTTISATMNAVRNVAELKAKGQRTDARVKPGDIIFFRRAAKVPILAIVKRRTSDGGVLAVGPVRNRLREIKIDLRHRSTRRSGLRVLNSFIRAKRPGDPPRTAYLAGQLITQIRRYTAP